MRGVLFVGILVCMIARDKSRQSVLAKVRGGTAPLQVKMGKWRGINTQSRKIVQIL